jgi:hypothetical protein
MPPPPPPPPEKPPPKEPPDDDQPLLDELHDEPDPPEGDTGVAASLPTDDEARALLRAFNFPFRQ